MAARQVPRNIDKPNRITEFLFTFLVVYYGSMFLLHEPLISMLLAFVAMRVVYQLTIDKPEGQVYRLLYRYFSYGGMIPTPRKVKKFEM